MAISVPVKLQYTISENPSLVADINTSCMFVMRDGEAPRRYADA